MGFDVAEISELAALRPIQTAVGGARATEVPGEDDGTAVADTGCVTPTASGAQAAMAGGVDDDGAAVDTSCVTPRSSGCTAQAAMAGGVDDDGAAVDTSCVTPRSSGCTAMLPIPPLQQDDGVDVGFATPLATGGEIGPRDGCGARGTAGDEGSFTTPTTADSALVPATVCPPAPRKSAPVPTRKGAPLQQRLFFYPVPHDLTTVFVAVPQRPPPAKKMRAHMVESSVPT